MTKPRKVPRPIVLGYFIGAGHQSFGSAACWRCIFCGLVHRTYRQTEQHEATCVERATVRRRERMR